MAKKKYNDEKFRDLTKEIDLEAFRDSVKSEFLDFDDARIQSRCTYPAWYLLLVILCGYLAGCNTIEDISDYAKLRAAWFTDLTGTAYGTLSYNTLWWFLARVNPEAFKQQLSKWFKRLPVKLKDQLLLIDGKRLRGVSNDEHITHLVELFAAEDRLVIAQSKVPKKAGEAQALPELLDTVDITGAIVSMDALYAHVKDIQVILDRGADYIVGIKDNQPTLAAEVRNVFQQAYDANYEYVDIDRMEKCEKGHGRILVQQIAVMTDLDWLPQRDEWQLKSLVEVRSERNISGAAEPSVRYYGSSRAGTSKQFSDWIKNHWAIENNLHWVADVVYGEDASLADAGHAAENMSLIRRITMNIIQAFDPSRGISAARRCATHCPEYLRGLLGKVFC